MPESGKSKESKVLRPSGPICGAAVDSFKDQLDALVHAGSLDLRIDLSDAETIDAKGLAVVVACHRMVASRAGSLSIATGNSDVRRLFEVLKLSPPLNVVEA
jgi:anti-anti-sigma factor